MAAVLSLSGPSSISRYQAPAVGSLLAAFQLMEWHVVRPFDGDFKKGRVAVSCARRVDSPCRDSVAVVIRLVRAFDRHAEILGLRRRQRRQLHADLCEIGRAHVCTPVTNAHLVCSTILEKK